jgi:hypothetical protein
MHVTTPLIVPKSPAHSLKAIIKNFMLLLGVSYHGWKNVHVCVGKDNYSRLPDHRMEERNSASPWSTTPRMKRPSNGTGRSTT